MSYIFSNGAAAMRRAAKATYTKRVTFNGTQGTVDIPNGRIVKWIAANQPNAGTLSMGTILAGSDLVDGEAVNDVPFPIEVGYEASANVTLYFTTTMPMAGGWIDVYMF